jgi:hypothetical protein
MMGSAREALDFRRREWGGLRRPLGPTSALQALRWILDFIPYIFSLAFATRAVRRYTSGGREGRMYG